MQSCAVQELHFSSLLVKRLPLTLVGTPARRENEVCWWLVLRIARSEIGGGCRNVSALDEE